MEPNTTASPRPHAGRRSNQEINEIIAEFESSEFTIEEYCEYKGLNVYTFQSWLQKHKEKDSARFVELSIKDEPITETLFATYRGLHFYQPMSAEFFKSLIS